MNLASKGRETEVALEWTRCVIGAESKCTRCGKEANERQIGVGSGIELQSK